MAEASAREGAAASKPKTKKKVAEDLHSIQADVATFAASLGLSAKLPGAISSGFDDSDFRKRGPIRKGGKSTEDSAGKEGSKEGSEKEEKKEKKKKNKKKREDSPETMPIKPNGKKAEFREEILSDEDEVKPQKGQKGKKGKKEKKEKGEGIEAETRSKFGEKKKKGPEPGSAKIHEVINAALAGEELPTQNPKKRKGSWNENEGKEGQGDFPPKRTFFGANNPDSELVRKLREEAQQLSEKASQDFEKSQQKNSDAQWLRTAIRSGTSSDKVAAMTVILQENPKANVRTLDALIGMLTSKAGKRHAATGIEALKELFIFTLLPDRKLKYLAQQPLASLSQKKERASTLMEWYWEDCLKHRYEKYVLALEESTKDSLAFLKEKALKTVYELLKAKPEQERKLLSTLVNKLGDPERKMASNASYFLSCLLTAHPNMKKVVIDEVDGFVFRKNVGLKARYYATVFLNQIVLSNRGEGPKLAKQLIDLYFALFKAVTSVIKEDNDYDTKDKRKRGDKGQKKGFGKHKGPDKEKEKKPIGFVMEIDSRLLSALLTGVNRALPYLKSEDLDNVTQENTVLFRLVHSPNFNIAVQALLLLHQLLTKSQAISDRFYRALYSVFLSKALFKSSKAEMFLGLVFKALKSDVDTRRISAFAKRLIQVAMHHPPQFACGSLLLLSEVLKARPPLWNLVLQAEENDEKEHFEDARDSDSEAEEKKEDQEAPNSSAPNEDVWPRKGSYDPKHRDPLYCNDHRMCWWELSLLASHVHPSVAAMARTLLAGANIVYNGDPLRDLALGVFLDRFAEKKPKALKVKQEGTWHGSSLTLPSRMGGASGRPMGEEFASMPEDQVAPDDLVFHKYYVNRTALGSRKLKKKKKTDEDEDDITGNLLGSEAFEDDSEDEEVDVILEKEADIEMEGGDVSSAEEEDLESDEEIELNDKEEEGEDGSEVDEEYDDSEDEEADELVQAGLEMSSDDDDDTVDDDDEIMASEDDSLDTTEPIEPSKQTKSKKLSVSKGKKTKELSKPTELVKTTKTKKPSKDSNLISGKHKKSIFEEAPSDDDY